MKDQRLKVFRAALDSLVESLDAVVRVARWEDAEEPPEPLRTAVAKLGERLAVADRLVAGTFVGSPGDKNKVAAMCTTIERLAAAYVAYRKRVETSAGQTKVAAAALQTEIADATESAGLN